MNSELEAYKKKEKKANQTMLAYVIVILTAFLFGYLTGRIECLVDMNTYLMALVGGI